MIKYVVVNKLYIQAEPDLHSKEKRAKNMKPRKKIYINRRKKKSG
jgi:hypothetical protein